MTEKVDLHKKLKKSMEKANDKFRTLYSSSHNDLYPAYISENDHRLDIIYVVRANNGSCYGEDVQDYKLETAKLKAPLKLFVEVLLKKVKEVTEEDIGSYVYRAYGLLKKGETQKDSDLDYYGSWTKTQTFSLNLIELIDIIEADLNGNIEED